MTEQSARLQLSWQRKLAFAVMASLLSTAVMLGGCLVADLYAHSRLEKAAGLNVWGYRGHILGRKKPGEVRIAVLGGSTAFGYGVRSDESIPAYLEAKLAGRRRAAGQGSVSVANLAYNNEGAFAAKQNLITYAYLQPDVAVFHDGYNDLSGPNPTVFRQLSPLFRVTGYMPVLPLVLEEKAMQLRYGSLEEAYRIRAYEAGKGQSPVAVFRPGLADRTTAAALSAASDVSHALERQLDALNDDDGSKSAATMEGVSPKEQALGCGQRWATFCQMVADNIDYALDHGMQVLVIGQPYHPAPIHRQQQQAMAEMIRARYAARVGVTFVDLGTAVDLTDRSLAYDGVHLTAAGNERMADRLVEPMMEILGMLSTKGSR